jgi:hypothetical protein
MPWAGRKPFVVYTQIFIRGVAALREEPLFQVCGANHIHFFLVQDAVYATLRRSGVKPSFIKTSMGRKASGTGSYGTSWWKSSEIYSLWGSVKKERVSGNPGRPFGQWVANLGKAISGGEGDVEQVPPEAEAIRLPKNQAHFNGLERPTISIIQYTNITQSL